jgi:7,8-dihydropterin-6-yl-methyl-4-(beta-D-ribofuranosyl)aminobenzene 5'-phosphate synthase
MYAVIGGMHLVRASHTRIARTIESLKEYEVKKIVPLHCTGQTAVDSFREALGDRCLSLGVGGQVKFS